MILGPGCRFPPTRRPHVKPHGNDGQRDLYEWKVATDTCRPAGYDECTQKDWIVNYIHRPAKGLPLKMYIGTENCLTVTKKRPRCIMTQLAMRERRKDCFVCGLALGISDTRQFQPMPRVMLISSNPQESFWAEDSCLALYRAYHQPLPARLNFLEYCTADQGWTERGS